MSALDWSNWDARKTPNGRGISPLAFICMMGLFALSAKGVILFQKRADAHRHVQAGDFAAYNSNNPLARSEYQKALQILPKSHVLKEKISKVDPNYDPEKFDTSQTKKTREKRRFILEALESIRRIAFWVF